jgi:hypothetical protein
MASLWVLSLELDQIKTTPTAMSMMLHDEVRKPTAVGSSKTDGEAMLDCVIILLGIKSFNKVPKTCGIRLKIVELIHRTGLLSVLGITVVWNELSDNVGIHYYYSYSYAEYIHLK